MKTKRGILILGIGLVLLLCCSIPVAESFTVNTSSVMDFLPKVIAAFAKTSGGPVVAGLFATIRSGTESTGARLEANTAGHLNLPSGTAIDGSIEGLSATNSIALNAPIFAGEAHSGIRDAGSTGGASLGAGMNEAPLAGEPTAANAHTSVNTRGSNVSPGGSSSWGSSSSGSDLSLHQSPASPGNGSGIQTELERAFQPGNVNGVSSQPNHWMDDDSLTAGSSSTALSLSADLHAAGTQSLHAAGIPGTEPLYDTGLNTTRINAGMGNSTGYGQGDTADAADAGGTTLPNSISDSRMMNNPNAETYDALRAPGLIGSNVFGEAGQLPAGPRSTQIFDVSAAEASIPEPATLALLGSGLAGLCYLARRRRES